MQVDTHTCMYEQPWNRRIYPQPIAHDLYLQVAMHPVVCFASNDTQVARYNENVCAAAATQHDEQSSAVNELSSGANEAAAQLAVLRRSTAALIRICKALLRAGVWLACRDR